MSKRIFRMHDMTLIDLAKVMMIRPFQVSKDNQEARIAFTIEGYDSTVMFRKHRAHHENNWDQVRDAMRDEHSALVRAWTTYIDRCEARADAALVRSIHWDDDRV